MTHVTLDQFDKDAAVFFEQLHGTPMFLKACVETLNKLLVKKGVLTEEELKKQLFESMVYADVPPNETDPTDGTYTEVHYRRLVSQFAQHMGDQMIANMEKSGWDGDSLSSLISRLNDEVEELVDATDAFECVLRHPGSADLEGQYKTLVKEAADVANFAMIIADRAKQMMGGRD